MSLFLGRKRERMYKILLHNKAAKEYKKLNDKSIARISKAIRTIEDYIYKDEKSSDYCKGRSAEGWISR